MQIERIYKVDRSGTEKDAMLFSTNFVIGYLALCKLTLSPLAIIL